MNAEIVNGVIERLKAAYDHVFAKREKISREAGMEDVRVARENALKHPHLSTTPLPEALERANNVYNKLEREAAPLIEKATIALLAVDQAAREVEAVKTALNTKQLSEHSKAALGLYKEAVRVVDKLAGFAAKRWVLRQQGNFEIRIYADLMRWKARNHELDDPNSPWLCLLSCYAGREMDFELDPGERYGTSMPQQVADDMRAKRKRTGLRTFELGTSSTSPNETLSISDEKPEEAELLASGPASVSESVSPLPSVDPSADSSGDPDGVSDDATVLDLPVPTAAEYLPVATEIVKRDGTDDALNTAVGLPGRITTDYEAIVRNGEAAIASGSTVPHLAEYVQAARDRRALIFLAELRNQRALRLAERLLKDPAARASARAAGYELPPE